MKNKLTFDVTIINPLVGAITRPLGAEHSAITHKFAHLLRQNPEMYSLEWTFQDGVSDTLTRVIISVKEGA